MTGDNQDKLLGKNNPPVFGVIPNANPDPLPLPFEPLRAPHDDGTDFFNDKEEEEEEEEDDDEDEVDWDDDDFLDDEEDEDEDED